MPTKRKNYKGIMYSSKKDQTTNAWRPNNVKYLRAYRRWNQMVHKNPNYSTKEKKAYVKAYRQEKIESRYDLKQTRPKTYYKRKYKK